jgi:two-component system, sporulation sensor kinase E
MPNLAWIAQPDGNIFWYNQRFHDYTGLSLAELQGWGWQSIHDPQLVSTVVSRWTECLRRGEPFEMTFPIRRADGEFRQFLTRANPLKDPSGHVIRWFGTNTDITAEQSTLAALRNSEQRFRTAAAALSGLLWTNDPSGRMVGEQIAWGDFTGQSYEDYQGYGWASAVHPDDVQPTIQAWENSVREGKLFSFQHRVRRRDGTYRLFQVRALPVRNADDSVREWVGVHTDITEEREAEQALAHKVAELRRQKELVETIQLSNNFGFWRLQLATRDLFLSTSSLRLLGFPSGATPTIEEAFGRIHSEDREAVQKLVELSFSTGQYNAEFRIIANPDRKDVRWIRGIGRLLSPPGEPPYLVGLNMDITEQKFSAEALIRAEKLAIAGRLAASIAHEINNPLEAVTNLLYLLCQTQLDEEQRAYCDTIASELQRVSAMATHTLRFHRQSTRPRHTSIKTLVDSVLALFEGRIRNLSIDVVRRLSDTPQIFGFDGELRQVLANLIGNAIDALALVPEPRTLTIHTRTAHDPRTGDSGVSVFIADNGPGIPESAMSSIFDAFFTTKGDLGTGLGLWVSADIIRKHQGIIRVRSCQRPELHGAAFRIFLPHTAEHLTPVRLDPSTPVT